MERTRATSGDYRAAQESERMSGRGVVDEHMRAYYEQRAAEYDDWWLGRGIFAKRERPGWHDEAAALRAAVGALPPARTLDAPARRRARAPSPRRAGSRPSSSSSTPPGGGRVLHAGDWFVMVASER
jgi:hypothetical protein